MATVLQPRLMENLGCPHGGEGGGVDTECQFRVSRCGTESDGTEQNRKARVKVLGLEV